MKQLPAPTRTQCRRDSIAATSGSGPEILSRLARRFAKAVGIVPGAAFFLGLSQMGGLAADVTVSNLNDSGAGSLR